MKVSHITLSLLVSACVFLGATYLYGPSSEAAYEELQALVARMEANVEEMTQLRNQLVARAELLQRSTDAVGLEARNLQYYRSDERVVRIDGYRDHNLVQSPGTVMHPTTSRPDHQSTARIIAMIAFIVTLLTQLLVDRQPDPDYVTIRRASR